MSLVSAKEEVFSSVLGRLFEAVNVDEGRAAQILTIISYILISHPLFSSANDPIPKPLSRDRHPFPLFDLPRFWGFAQITSFGFWLFLSWGQEKKTKFETWAQTMSLGDRMRGVEGRSCEEFSLGYYGLCAVGGMLSAGTTHLAITPLDVLKVNMQVCFLP